MSETIDLTEVGEVAIEALKGRFSSWPLHEPAPSASELETAFELAMRAPDHGGMKPWRFVTVQGEARAALAEILVEAARARGHEDPERYRRKQLAAPMTIVPAVRLIEGSEKVPVIEQWLAAGAAVMNLLNGTCWASCTWVRPRHMPRAVSALILPVSFGPGTVRSADHGTFPWPDCMQGRRDPASTASLWGCPGLRTDTPTPRRSRQVQGRACRRQARAQPGHVKALGHAGRARVSGVE